MDDLSGRRVVVIGGSAGIGYASAEMALAAGAEVAISARGEERLAAAAARLTERFGRDVPWRVIDMRERAEVAAYLASVAPIDHLLLPGANVYRTTFADLDEELARASFDAKMWAPFFAAYDARPHMRRGGSIVFYTGLANRRPVPGYVVGAVIDGALDAATRSLAYELAPEELRVNCVSPGIIETAYVERISPEVKEELFSAYAVKVPVGRVGQAEDCAKAAMYLMTTGFVTGAVLRVDGGIESVP